MKIETLLNKARENAKKQVWLDYLDICDGNEEKTKELIKRERENGEFVKFVESETIDNIYKLIRTIRNTALMSDEEKKLQSQKFIIVQNGKNLKKELQ